MQKSQFTHAYTAHSTHRPVQCRLGGKGSPFGDGPGRQQPPNKLIIPGQLGNAPSSRPGGSLIIPGGPGGQPSFGGSITPPNTSDLKADGPAYTNFRPPPGFMDADNGNQTDIAASPEEMLNRIQSQAGHWHQLAKLFPPLQAKGYDANTIEEVTGLERKLQNIWSSAAHIYDSLKKSGQVPEDVLSHFDAPGGEHLLIELRFLSIAQRIDAAKYIVQNNFSDMECQVLARAIKEHERRNGQRDGFSGSPADCLAYKYYRDAYECRRPDDIEACVKKGLAVVETDEARAKLSSILSGNTETKNELPSATLTLLRLTKEELGYRPIPLAGDLKTATAAAVRAAPKVSQQGVFGNFTVPANGLSLEWVPLPAWSILTLASQPTALFVTDCAELPALRATASAKSDDDLRKLKGPGLLVVDTDSSNGDVELDASMYYVVEIDNGGVDVVDGVAAAGGKKEKVVGPVLFLARPPARDATGVTTAELLSL